jgi:hypothetical protein
MSKVKLIYFLLFLVLFKFLTIYSIQINRELPIGADDAFIYISQSNLNFNSNQTSQKIVNSIKDFVEGSIAEDKKNNLDSKDIFQVQGYLKNTFFMYSKLFSLIQKYLNIDSIELWWIFNYFCQILIFVSFVCLTQTYEGSKKKINKITLLASFFLSLSIPHHITATPMTWGTCFYLISIYLIFNKKKIINYFGIIFNFISFFFHPGIFLISVIFIMTHGTIFFMYRNSINFIKFIKLLIPLIIYFFYEYFFFLFDIQKNSNVVNSFNLLSEYSKNNLLNIFNFNYKRSFLIFYKSVIPLLPFFLKYLFFPIYIYSIFLIFKKKKELFFLNIFSIIILFIGCFYIISPNHPGHLTYYLSQATIPIMLITLFNMYRVISERIDKRFNLKKSFTIIVIGLTIFLPNSFRYYEMLKIRTNIQNYENITKEIKKINLESSNDAIIIGDKLTLAIFAAYFSGTHIYLEDKFRKNNYWSFNNQYNIVGYFSVKSSPNEKISKDIFVSKEKYTFKYIKEFKYFYFLHNFEKFQ